MRFKSFLLAFIVVAGAVLPAGQALAAPPNNAFSAAVTLSQGTVAGSTAGATAEPGEPDHFGEGRTVWYRWTAPGTGGTKVSVCGSSNFVAVYTGASVAGLTLVTDGGCDRTWMAKAGVTYRVAVANRYNLPDGGPFTLQLKQVTTLPNVVLAEPLTVSAAAGEVKLKETTGAEDLYWMTCDVDGKGSNGTCYDAAAPRFRWSTIGNGQHTLTVQVRDGYGNVDPTPLTHTWTVDASPPDTVITDVVQSTTVNAATVTFTSTEAGSSFQCALRGGPFTACTSPYSFSWDTSAPRFEVRAFDAVGNGDVTTATWLATPKQPLLPKPVVTPAPTPVKTPVPTATPVPPRPAATCALAVEAPATLRVKRALTVRVRSDCRVAATLRLRGRTVATWQGATGTARLVPRKRLARGARLTLDVVTVGPHQRASRRLAVRVR